MHFKSFLQDFLRILQEKNGCGISLDKVFRYGMIKDTKIRKEGSFMKKRRVLSWIPAVLLTAALLVFPAYATESAETEPPAAPVEISTPEDLLAMAEDPAGNYILVNDVDMEGIAWKSLDFSGTFDGNGYAILNLELSQPGDERPYSYDGNRKKYETAYVGFFGTLRDAEVKNLKLLGVHGVVQSDEPCYLGGIAGYMEKSVLSGCTVSGTLELRAHDRMFGVGGLVGYGAGRIENCDVDVTLICVDTDEKKRDEQFLGGILANGFADIENCRVKIDGFVSEFGYCHNGGLVGMLYHYPLGDWTCSVKGNTVTGKITFFECNTNRRAYCAALVGEPLTKKWKKSDNTEDFLRDERKQYDVELRPEMCESPAYTEEVTPAGCESYGYTDHTCGGCGYTYRDAYKLPEHIPGEYVQVKAPTVEEEGLEVATCPCGLEYQRTLEKLPPPPTEAPTEPETTVPAPAPTEPAPAEDPFPVMTAVFLTAAMALIILIMYLLVRKKNRVGKYSRR